MGEKLLLGKIIFAHNINSKLTPITIKTINQRL